MLEPLIKLLCRVCTGEDNFCPHLPFKADLQHKKCYFSVSNVSLTERECKFIFPPFYYIQQHSVGMEVSTVKKELTSSKLGFDLSRKYFLFDFSNSSF